MKNAMLFFSSLLLLLGTATFSNASGQEHNKARQKEVSAGSAQKTLVICGSGDSQNLLRHLAGAYEQNHPEIHIDVPDSIGSSGGIKATATGKCDLGRVARPLKETEKKLNLSYLHFADSPVVFVVNSSVTGISSINGQQVVGIYAGTITHWSQLGGPHEKIYVANREKGDSSRTTIEQHLPAFNAIKKMVGKILYTTPENVAAINRYKFTIGYSSLAQAENQPHIAVLQFDGVSPDRENVIRGTYKLVAPLGLVWENEPDQQVKDFIDFLHSPTAEKIMAEHGAFSTLSTRW